jgi:UDP-hydrolysing UDP-N-acetyl-D-glucosamine 2-epimerase
LINSDSIRSRVKTMSIFLQNAIDVVDAFRPDLILYAGDREDAMAAAVMAGYLEIPSLHVYGGDHSKDGYIDNPIRHAISKLSSAHMVSHEEHARRLIEMGESEKRVFPIGSIALDRFVEFQPLSVSDIRSHFKINNGFDEFALVIFHPVTEERSLFGYQFEILLRGLEDQGIQAFVSLPNTDPGNRQFTEVLNKFLDSPNFVFYKNLGRDLFLSIMKQSSLMLGNSSAGVLEAASVPIPVINFGMRQRGRKAGDNVVFIDANEGALRIAIQKVQDPKFREMVSTIKNIYGEGRSARRAYDIIKRTNFKSLLAKREDILDKVEKSG